jgi:hypothetical protein
MVITIDAGDIDVDPYQLISARLSVGIPLDAS